MFLAIAVGFLFFVLRADGADPALWAVLGGAALIVAVGLVDDLSKARFKEFPVWPRLAVQILAATLAFVAGVRFTGFMNPFTETYVYLPMSIQYVLTVLWFVGLITAFNFMDGLDGLSGLLALVSGTTFFVVALHMNQPESAFMAVIFVGAVAGFLRYNLPPAKVYMGDSGAYLLGFMLAAISLHGAFKQATVISLTIPMLAMGVPIFDSILVVARRLLANKPAHIADSSNITHIHFRLLKNGMKPVHAVMLIFLLSACLNLFSIIVLLAF
ncbi:MAG: undecaprenyl/decaprenyl-phosphate alpha-N-acetylglucosaminyl 1-phosphate transferase [Defluviitaleaceae bacterium]|nr:undecaprenyl/decaprenyl-phosphate alpha-N-acetylglucosaminyl 1-phosphate transferase [Defluviitaleaceae bacterium]MCL2263557.1 undecaprenyl/decaprenyl-phosphate alpha-N-acetylglucosaminyl 1-phosphate transferase [Defluviitaleaceae bacterium]